MPFVKGKSGNQGGRPKASLSEALRLYISRNNPSDEQKRTYRECLIEKLVMSAMAGDLYAIREVFDRVDGKARQVIEGSDENPLSIVLKFSGTSVEW